MKIIVSVKPNARKDAIEKIDRGHYVIRLHAAPAEGKANSAFIKFLANHFDIPKSRITMISGFSSHKKIIEIV